MPTITPHLQFNGNAEEAMRFYVSVFKNSEIENINRDGPGPRARMNGATFRLEGQTFFIFNGGRRYVFTPAISFFVYCKTQKEIDRLWDALSEGGKKGKAGWLKDRYGVSWQIVPTALDRMLTGSDIKRSKRVWNAMLKMSKIEITALRAAYAQKRG